MGNPQPRFAFSSRRPPRHASQNRCGRASHPRSSQCLVHQLSTMARTYWYFCHESSFPSRNYLLQRNIHISIWNFRLPLRIQSHHHTHASSKLYSEPRRENTFEYSNSAKDYEPWRYTVLFSIESCRCKSNWQRRNDGNCKDAQRNFESELRCCGCFHGRLEGFVEDERRSIVRHYLGI